MGTLQPFQKPADFSAGESGRKGMIGIPLDPYAPPSILFNG